jgi:L-threonylcarbamoyladenylate synthase
VRWPAHPFVQALIRECDFPLAAPSANRSTQISPTTAEHVRKSLGGRIPLIVDGGASHVGIESTVLDLSVAPPRILRPGMIHEESLLTVAGELEAGGEPGRILKSPGMLPKHYAPRAALIVCQWKDTEDLRSEIARRQIGSSRCHVVAHTHIPVGLGTAQVSIIPHDPAAFARALYAELHRCDDAGAKVIFVEAPPESPEWRAIADRLRRAAS